MKIVYNYKLTLSEIMICGVNYIENKTETNLMILVAHIVYYMTNVLNFNNRTFKFRDNCGKILCIWWEWNVLSLIEYKIVDVNCCGIQTYDDTNGRRFTIFSGFLPDVS